MEQKEIWNKEYIFNKGKWKKETLDLPIIFKNKNVLEIGVGNGKTLKSIIRQKPNQVYAIDYSLESIKYCKENFIFDNVIITCTDVRKMSFEEETFEVIVCNYTLNNMLKRERAKAVSEIYRVLKKNGVVLFQDFANGDFRQESGIKYKEKNTIIKKNGIICHFFDKKEIIDLFNKFNTKKIEIKITSPIKSKKDIKRKIINAIFKK